MPANESCRQQLMLWLPMRRPCSGCLRCAKALLLPLCNDSWWRAGLWSHTQVSAVLAVFWDVLSMPGGLSSFRWWTCSAPGATVGPPRAAYCLQVCCDPHATGFLSPCCSSLIPHPVPLSGQTSSHYGCLWFLCLFLGGYQSE